MKNGTNQYPRFTKMKSLQGSSKKLEGASKTMELSRSLKKCGFHPRSLEKLDSMSELRRSEKEFINLRGSRKEFKDFEDNPEESLECKDHARSLQRLYKSELRVSYEEAVDLIFIDLLPKVSLPT